MSEDIEALQAQLMKAREEEGWFITGDQAKDFSRALTALVADRNAAIKQRDEARELFCRHIAYQMSRLTGVFDPKEVAAKQGWDGLCKEEGGGA